MARKSIDDLGDLQRSVMEAVWELGGATVNEVRDRLNRDKDLAYTTVLSAMQKLEKAGWLKHRAEGRTYVYLATRSRETEGVRSLREFTKRVFQGDPHLLFQHFIEDDQLNEDDLAKLQKAIAKRKKEMHDA